jgi:2,4-dienoyl-CoA reductase (NADPH2)
MSTQSQYPHLFRPLELGHIQLKNRFVMGSMHTGLEEEKEGLQKLAAFYHKRAKGGVGLIVTGGIAPNRSGRLAPFAKMLTNQRQARSHRVVTDAVHQAEGKIVLQILHSGRYGYHPLIVCPSKVKSPISPFKPRALTNRAVLRTIKHFARCAKLAKYAGYDGVEIMGSEGYLINQFLTTHTNLRKDSWGGSYTNRMRFAIETVKAVRESVGNDFIIIYRLSMIDLVEKGSSWDEVVLLAKAIEAAGASIINTGIGWHEARVPTIATMVPRGAFVDITKKIKPELNIPVITSNRINTPELAEEVLCSGSADLVSMARPFLADSDFVVKAEQGKSENINTCIACNQACLDLVFQNKKASCLVNPYACNETTLVLKPASIKKRLAVIGAGPAGLAFAVNAAQRGHCVDLFDKSDKIGGQFNMAKTIPGKEEFYETLRYFEHSIKDNKINLKLKTRAEPALLKDYDEIILATGVHPRTPAIPGINHQKVSSYIDVLAHKKPVGKRVAIIGAGGIGFDVAEFLAHSEEDDYYNEWGIDISMNQRGGLKPPSLPLPKREIYLLQRKKDRLGKQLGKTTGWIHRQALRKKDVRMLGGVSYEKIDDAGLHISVEEKPLLLEVDNIIICAGQESLRDLKQPVEELGKTVHIVGGAHKALELDARAAILDATELALKI